MICIWITIPRHPTPPYVGAAADGAGEEGMGWGGMISIFILIIINIDIDIDMIIINIAILLLTWLLMYCL